MQPTAPLLDGAGDSGAGASSQARLPDGPATGPGMAASLQDWVQRGTALAAGAAAAASASGRQLTRTAGGQGG